MNAVLMLILNLIAKPIIKARVSDAAQEKAIISICEELIEMIDDAFVMAQDGWGPSDRVLLEQSVTDLLDYVPRDMEFPKAEVAKTLAWAIDKIASAPRKNRARLRRKEPR